MSSLRLVTLAPGHFHAALIQKEMLPGVDPRAHIFAPLDADLLAHLKRIAGFNGRVENPTSWQLDIRAEEDWRERFRTERPGNVAILSGRNKNKIDLMRMAVEAGMHVLADKPWIIEPDRVPCLAALLEKATRSGLIVHDMMTERFEITSILQREIVDDPDLFGIIENGSPDHPAVYMRSVHFLKKQVAGCLLRRPAWFFDVSQQGEALADVGVHLVDQVLWMLFADDPIDYGNEIEMIQAGRWPIVLDREQFAAITGLPDFPAELDAWRDRDRLHYYCNNNVTYKLRGICVRHDVLWDYETPPAGGDTHDAIFKGTRCSVVVRQAGGQAPELFVAPVPSFRNEVGERLSRRVEAWQESYPGVRVLPADDEFEISIPHAYRTSHEAHFAEVAAQFLKYVESPRAQPACEIPHLLAKYFITTQGVAMASNSTN